MQKYIELTCPFCSEIDFDLYGLQLHLQNGWCRVFGNVQKDNTISDNNPIQATEDGA